VVATRAAPLPAHSERRGFGRGDPGRRAVSGKAGASAAARTPTVGRRSSGRRFGGASRPGMPAGKGCRFGGSHELASARCSANLALRRWRERAKRRVRRPKASVSVASWKVDGPYGSSRFGGAERTGLGPWVRSTARGERRRRRRTALRGEQSSEGRNPMSGSGMKQGQQARGGSKRREVEKT
jgi:hypothetical protein